MRIKYILLLVLLCMPMGCVFEEKPAHVVATVNDRPITLATLEALQEANMSGMGIFEQFSLHQLRKQYGKTLGNLLVYELVLQALEEQGLSVRPEDVQKYEKAIAADYPQDEFEKYFVENGLNKDAWRTVLRYNLALQMFTDQVLRKDFVPSLAAVQAYYEKHKERFMLEENYAIYVVDAEDKKNLQGLQRTDDLLARLEELQPVEMSMAHSEVPKQWQKMVYALKDSACTSIIQDEKQFSVICLKEHVPARVLEPEEAYVYIEDFLADEELIFVFDKWLEQAVVNSKIRISKHLVQDMY